MHAIEKILAKAAGKKTVTTGEIINCKVDLAGINDLYLQTVRSFFEMGGKKVNDPKKIVMFLDHYAPASTITQADNQKQFREFCWDQGIDRLMDVDQGVCHQILADKGLVYPGMVLVITDSHTTTHGAFGAFGTQRLRHDPFDARRGIEADICPLARLAGKVGKDLVDLRLADIGDFEHRFTELPDFLRVELLEDAGGLLLADHHHQHGGTLDAGKAADRVHQPSALIMSRTARAARAGFSRVKPRTRPTRSS